MTILFSGSALSFYDSNIHTQNIPSDAVEITVQKHVELLTGQASGQQIVADVDGLPVLVDRELQVISQRKLSAKTAIDNAAGDARLRYVSTGNLVEEEYRLTQQQTQAWRDAGSPAEAVPAAISTWSNAAGMTAEQAAADIEQTAIQLETLLMAVRQIRLAGKAAVDAAADQNTADDMMLVAQPFIDQLNAL